MSMQESAPETSISKAEFARLCRVSKPRVTQWIDERKIHGPAFDGEGRRARIFPSVAASQLKISLDPSHALGNGLGTRLNFGADGGGEQVSAPAGRSQRPTASKTPPETDEVGDAIRREQLEGLQRKNRREAIEEEAQSGRFTDAEAAQAAMGKLAARLVVGFEGSLPELAGAIAAHFRLPQRDVLHVLRGAYREVRGKQAEAAKSAAGGMPEFVEAEVATAADAEREPEPV